MAPCKPAQRGFTLLELSLVISIALTLLASSLWALQQHNDEAHVSQCKMMLATLRAGIAAYHYRTGTYPSATELENNQSSSAPPFPICSGIPMGASISEPVSGIARFATATASYDGGWAYIPSTGQVFANLDPANYPGDNPNLW